MHSNSSSIPHSFSLRHSIYFLNFIFSIKFFSKKGKSKFLKQIGYHYSTKLSDPTKMVELHVDTFLSLLDEFKEKEGRSLNWKQGCVDKYITTKYGGNPSVRKPEDTKMLISFGHDEAIFRKNTFLSYCWFGSDGEQQCVPKEDGCGIMISALQLREFGFGFDVDAMNDNDYKKVNAF